MYEDEEAFQTPTETLSALSRYPAGHHIGQSFRVAGRRSHVNDLVDLALVAAGSTNGALQVSTFPDKSSVRWHKRLWRSSQVFVVTGPAGMIQEFIRLISGDIHGHRR